MKYVMQIAILSILFLGFNSCDLSTPQEETSNIEMPEFPAYDVLKYGEGPVVTSLHHQNCCECKTGGCSAKKCCSGTNGGNCDCSCIDGFWSDNCSCTGCHNQATFSMWLDDDQFVVWEEFAEIVSQDESVAGVTVMEGHLMALAAVEDDDEEAYFAGKASIAENVASLNDNTKVLLNDFLDRHGFIDERL